MELQPLFQRVIGLDIHQDQVTACAIVAEPDGTVTMDRRQFGAFQRDRRALAHKMLRIIYVMLSTGTYYRDANTDYVALNVQCDASRWTKKLIKLGVLPQHQSA